MRAGDLNLEKLVDKCTVGLVIVEDGRIIFTNKHLRSIVDYTESYLKGRRFTDFFTGEDQEKVKKYYEARLSGKQAPKDYDIRVKGKGGVLRWVNVQPTKIRVEGKDIMAYFVKDISEQRELIKGLKESRNHYESIINHMPFIAFTLNPKGEFIDGNRAAEDVFGLNLDELIGKKFSSAGLLSKKQLVKAWVEFRKNLKGEVTDPTIYEVNIDGEERLIELIGIPLKENGKVVAVLDIGEDVTKEKKVQDRLRKNEEKYKYLYDNSLELLITVDLKGRIINLNNTAKKSLKKTGYKPKEVLNHNLKKFVDSKDLSKVLKSIALESMGKPTKPISVTIKGKKDNIIIEFAPGSIPIKNDKGKLIALQVSARDVTQRVKREQELKRSEERYSTLFNQSSDAIMIINLKGLIKDVNEQYLKAFDQKRKNVIGKKFDEFDFEYDLSKKEVFSKIKQLIKHKKINNLELRIYDKKKKKETFLKLNAKLIKLPEGFFIQVVMRDVTKERRIEKVLEEEKEKLEYYLDNAPVLMLVLSKEGRIELINEEGERIIEGEKEELIGKEWFKFIPKEERSIVKNVFERIINGKRKLETHENHIISLKGNKRLIKWRNKLLKDSEGNITSILSSGEDITESRRQEQELKDLRQKEELEQVRKNFLLLVTHELKQPLTPIMGYADLLKDEIVNVDQLKFLDRIINGAQEMYELITKIINLMRLETGQLMLKKQKISLKKLVNESLRKKASLINLKSINLKTSIKDADFKGDESLLKDVLVNLIDNAVKFSDEKGVIELSTKVSDKYVTISVKDEGPGIRKEDQKELFKTFSQTIEGKKRGGFGIGLSMVKMVVEKHKGTVSIDSEYGKGSKFTIKLPRGDV